MDFGFGGPEGRPFVLEVQPRRSDDDAAPDPASTPRDLPRARYPAVAANGGVGAQQPVYYPDDPIAPGPGDAGRVQGGGDGRLSDPYDFIENTFFKPGDRGRSARDEHQHHRRSARLELVHQSRRRQAAHGRGGAPGPRHDQRSGAGQVDDRVGEDATASRPGFTIRDSSRRTLVHQVRSASRTRKWPPAPRWSRRSCSGRLAIHVPENHLAVMRPRQPRGRRHARPSAT